MSRILAIEDSPTLLGLLAKCLQGGGHEVVTATNGEEGLAQLTRHRPEMVVTDLNMPVMNGLDFVEAARGLREGRGVPIVLLMTETAPELMARARFVKATGWLQKPLDGPRLLGLIAEMCD